jgi:hypothetical protein
LLSLCLLVAGCAGGALPPESATRPVRASLQAELAELDGMDEVSAGAVGYAGTPGEFFLLGKRFLARGSPDDFVRMAADRVPITRVMGLHCLAHADPKRAIPILKSHFNDKDRVHTLMGCMGSDMSVGDMARMLLRNPLHIDFKSRDPLTLLTPAELLADDIARLNADAPADRVDWKLFYPEDSIQQALEDGSLKLSAETIDQVARVMPGVPRFRIVKGIGRAAPHPAIRTFLTQRLIDNREEPLTRLAAASALTRESGVEVLAALRSQRAFLDKAEAGLCDRLLAAVELRGKLQAVHGGPDSGSLFLTAREWPPELDTSDHPMVLEYIPQARDRARAPSDTQLDEWPIPPGQYVRLMGRAAEFGHAWDTYSDVALSLHENFRASNYQDIDSEALTRSFHRALRARE